MRPNGKTGTILYLIIALMPVHSCERIDLPGVNEVPKVAYTPAPEEVAGLISALPLGRQQIAEVHDAVNSSCGNGYDEEYMMKDLFNDPGSGVGDGRTKAAGVFSGEEKEYEHPLRDMIKDYLSAKTKSAAPGEESPSPEDYMAALADSDLQIYWPYSEEWDGAALPVITFDPADGSTANIGYRIIVGENGERTSEEVVVDEEMARRTPVWVVNRNSDSGFTSLEILRKLDPEWGQGGGSVIVKPQTAGTSAEKLRSLVLKDFTAKRNFDPWFAGASEFFVKCGSVEDFRASTEEELKLYVPSVTDFMVVVKRDRVGTRVPFNAILVSDWTSQLETCAFMITEDDGGTISNWKCEAMVKINSKSYGFDISIPFNSKDDVAWRGQLSGRFFEKYNNITGHFGDIDLTFSITEQ